ncbi:tail fiber assembly protein [Klebsiella pneumoniae]
MQTEYQVAVRSDDNSSWSVTDDYRGITVYDIQTLASHVITEPGPIPDTVTTSAPSTPYDKWDGSAWVTDANAQHAADVIAADMQKKELISQVTADISILQDAVALNMATDEEKSRLTSLQTYRVLLNRVDTSLAPGITWPVITSALEVNNG